MIIMSIKGFLSQLFILNITPILIFQYLEKKMYNVICLALQITHLRHCYCLEEEKKLTKKFKTSSENNC